VRHSFSRPVAVAALAILVPLGLTACGSDPKVSQTDVSSKLKSDTQFKSLNDKQRDCLADLMLKKGNKGDLKQWIDGKKKLEDVGGDSDGIESAAGKCITS
jgi:hypothetical protein